LSCHADAFPAIAADTMLIDTPHDAAEITPAAARAAADTPLRRC